MGGRRGRRIGACLEQLDGQSRWIAQPQLMQFVITQAHEFRLEIPGREPRACLREFRQYEAQ